MAAVELNEDEKTFWTNNNLDLAYTRFNFYFTKEGYIVCSTPKVLIAKLWMLNYWFGITPENNRFQDLIISKDIAIIKENKRKKIYFIIGCGVGSMISIILIKCLNSFS